MTTASFIYHAPTTLREAVQLLRSHNGDARVLAGGMSLVPAMRLRLVQPDALVDLSRVRELSGVRVSKGTVTIGAMTTYDSILTSPHVHRRLPLLVEATHEVGDVQVRNRGTIGGALALADPAGDLPAVALALDARIHVAGGKRARAIAATRFFLDSYTTALDETEVVTAVEFPAQPARSGGAYVNFANQASRFAVVGVAAQISVDRRGVCQQVRIGVTGVGPVAYRARAAERSLTGVALDANAIDRAAHRAGRGIELQDDHHGSADYRAALLVTAGQRALASAALRAGVIV